MIQNYMEVHHGIKEKTYNIQENHVFSLKRDNGETKNRYVHRISDNPGGLLVMNFFQSEEVTSYFNPAQ